eukprot:738387-Rhodomonas_salina.1
MCSSSPPVPLPLFPSFSSLVASLPISLSPLARSTRALFSLFSPPPSARCLQAFGNAFLQKFVCAETQAEVPEPVRIRVSQRVSVADGLQYGFKDGLHRNLENSLEARQPTTRAPTESCSGRPRWF